MARWYGSTTERALNGKHVADGKRLKAILREGESCWRCHQPMYSWQELERDHVIDRVLGGAAGPAVLAHAKCNRSAGATMGNQLRGFTPAVAATGGTVTCKTCGRPYHYAARGCEICGLHYHPSYGQQRTCSRACGAVLVRRNRMVKGWVPPEQRAKPAPGVRFAAPPCICENCGRPCATRQQRTCSRQCASELARQSARPVSVRAARPSPVHLCASCCRPTNRFRWCDACLCRSANAKGYRCGNVAGADGQCEYHAGMQMRSSRQW